MSELHVLAVDRLQAGMVLAENLERDGKILAREGFVINDRIIGKLKDYGKATISVFLPEGAAGSVADNSVSSILNQIFAPGEFICLQGEESHHIFLLKSGKLEVVVINCSASQISQVEVARKGIVVGTIDKPGTSFGEIGAILETPRSASIRAVVESVVSSIPIKGDGLKQTITSQPRLGLNIALNLTGRIKENNERIRKMTGLLGELREKLQFFFKAYVTICNDIGQIAAQSRDGFLRNLHNFAKNSKLYSMGRMKGTVKETAPPCIISLLDCSPVTNLQELESGEVLFNEGEPGDKLFILTSGRLGIYVAGTEVARIETKGEIIGEVAVIMGYSSGHYEARTATVKALTDAQLVVVPGDRLETVVTSDPAILVMIVRSLSKRLPESNSKLVQTMAELDLSVEKLKNAEEFRSLSSTMDSSHSRDLFSRDIQLSDLVATKMEQTLAEMSERIKVIQGK